LLLTKLFIIFNNALVVDIKYYYLWWFIEIYTKMYFALR